MTFMVGLMVDEYGYLTGGTDVFPVDVIKHDWETPYPTYREVAEFTWEPGELGVQPGVFRHPEIRDWVCDEPAWEVLTGIAPADFHLIGRGDLGGKRLFVVQIVTMLEIVDREESIIDKYSSYEILRFPAFVGSAESETDRRAFRVPGSYTDVFVGNAVEQVLETAGVTGLTYTLVPFTNGSTAQ